MLLFYEDNNKRDHALFVLYFSVSLFLCLAFYFLAVFTHSITWNVVDPPTFPLLPLSPTLPNSPHSPHSLHSLLNPCAFRMKILSPLILPLFSIFYRFVNLHDQLECAKKDNTTQICSALSSNVYRLLCVLAPSSPIKMFHHVDLCPCFRVPYRMKNYQELSPFDCRCHCVDCNCVTDRGQPFLPNW